MAAIPRSRTTTKSRQRGSGPVPITGPSINIESERHLLGKLFRFPEHIVDAMEILEPADFFEERHQVTFDAFCRITARDEIITPALVDEELRRMGKLRLVEQVYIHELERGLSPFDDVQSLAGVVLENSLSRQEEEACALLMQHKTTGALTIARLEMLQQRRVNGSRSFHQESPGVLIESVERQDVSWLWHRRIARGKVTILDGDPGVGKGLLTLDIAARRSRGARLPHDPRPSGSPGNVVLFTPEDDVADTIRPRLEAAGADLHRIRFLSTIEEMDYETRLFEPHLLSIPRDINVFEDTILRDGADLLIIDPITAVLDAGVKTNNDAEVRGALMPLSLMAARTGCGVLIVRHLNKSGGDNAIYRGGGSIAFTGLARIGLLLTPHPDGDAKRVLAPVKSNVGRPGEALSFALVSEPVDAIPHLEWDEEACEYDTHTLLTTRVSDQRRDIVNILRDAGAGAELSPHEIAEELGITDPSKESSLRHVLGKMMRAGAVVSRTYGKYSLPDRSLT